MASASQQLDSIRKLFDETPDGMLHMCFLRPTPAQVCPELPFLVEGSATLAPLRPTVLRPDAVLRLDAGGGELAHECADAAAEAAPAHPTERQILALVEVALLSGSPLPPSLAEQSDAEWVNAFSVPPSSRLSALQAHHVQRLVEDIPRTALADLLTQHVLPRLLAEADPREPTLPPGLSDLIAQLLRRGSYLQLPADEFKQQVLEGFIAHGALRQQAAEHARRLYSGRVCV